MVCFLGCLEPVLSQTHRGEGSESRTGGEVCVAGREQWRVHSQYPDFLRLGTMFEFLESKGSATSQRHHHITHSPSGPSFLSQTGLEDGSCLKFLASPE